MPRNAVFGQRVERGQGDGGIAGFGHDEGAPDPGAEAAVMGGEEVVEPAERGVIGAPGNGALDMDRLDRCLALEAAEAAGARGTDEEALGLDDHAPVP
jgi:hypothetical protein